MVEFRRCPYCNNALNLTESWVHDNCRDFTEFMLDEMLVEARKKVEMLLLKRKLLEIFKNR